MGQLLALDFDGVVNSYNSGWIKEDPLCLPDHAVPGAFDFIKLAQQHFEVHIHTSRLRYDRAEEKLKAWFFRELMNEKWTPMSAVALVSQLKFSAEKPPAHVTLDDRSIQFTGIFPKLDEIIEFRPWNRRNNLIPPQVPAIGSFWTHSSGRVYEVYDVTNADSDRQEKFPTTISYRGENGKKWSRKLTDWHRSFAECP